MTNERKNAKLVDPKVESENFSRKYPRKSYRKDVTFICDGQAGHGIGVEIGEGGLAFSTDRELVKDRKVIINFFLIEENFITVQVTVANVTNSDGVFTYGTKFDDISIALKRQIRTYVARTSHQVA